MKQESSEQTARYWVGQDKQEKYKWKKAGKRAEGLGGERPLHVLLEAWRKLRMVWAGVRLEASLPGTSM